MKAAWTAGLEEQRTKDVRGDFKSSLIIRKRLKEILEGRIETSLIAMTNKNNYDVANWPYLMADSVGYARAMREVINLIIEDE
jgi:hypothetical protein